MMNLERANELKNNLLWAEIVGELDHRIFLVGKKFQNCTAEQLPLLQNEVKILESIKRLPEDIINREEDVAGKT